MKKIEKDKNILCDYGCEQKAKFQFKNGKFCCCESFNSCPSKKKRSAENGKGKRHAFATPVDTEELCSFGCGEVAKFRYKNGSYCCSDDWHRCPNKRIEISDRAQVIWSDLDRRERLSKNQRKDLIAKPIPVYDKSKNCFYCGKIAKFWFKTNDKYCCCDRIERCPEVRIEISNRFKELWKDETFRNKITNQDYDDPERKRKQQENYRKWYEKNKDEFRRRMKEVNKNRLYTEEQREKARDRLLGKSFEELYGKEKAEKMKAKIRAKNKGKKMPPVSDETRSIMSEKKKEHWRDPNSSYNSKEFRDKKAKDSMKMWKNPTHSKKIQKSLHNSPNKVEQFLIELFNKLNLDYEFVGDWSLNINGRNPDFVNEKKKKLIEFFGEYYHSTIVDETKEEHETDRVEFFSKCGYETLVIWENELKNINVVIKKILEFDSK